MSTTKKIEIEFYPCFMKEQKKTKDKSGKVTGYDMIPSKNPKAWVVITVSNSTEFTPSQRLTKVRVNKLCESAQWDVNVGQEGQFKKPYSRY
jgi:hypothetical protein